MRTLLGAALLCVAMTGCIDWEDACRQNPGCSGSDAGGTDAGSPDGGPAQDAGAALPFSRYCSVLHQAVLASVLHEETVCGQPFRAEDLPHLAAPAQPYDAVLATLDCDPDGGALGPTWSKILQGLDAGRIRYDGLKAEQCRALGRELKPRLILPQHLYNITSLGIPPLFVRDDAGRLAQPCLDVLAGQVPQDGACSATEECAGDLVCVPAAGPSCGGTCRPRPKPGERCDFDKLGCDLSGRCEAQDAGTFCVALVPRGEACQYSTDCTFGLICESGRCAPRSGLGGPCSGYLATTTSSDFTPLGQCELGLVCVQVWEDGGPVSRGVCMKPAAASEPCGAPPSGRPPCGPCLSCRGFGATARCGTLGGAGDVCDTAGGGVGCLRRHICEGGVCTLPSRTGGPCNTLTTGCLYRDDYCKRSAPGSTTGICTRFPSLGDACGARFDDAPYPLCAEGYCQAEAVDRGHCRPYPGGGAICGDVRTDAGVPSVSLYCQRGFYCDSSAQVCRAKPVGGEPCFAMSCADSAWCDGTLCRDKGATGAACTYSGQCQDQCIDGKCAKPCLTNSEKGGGCKHGLREASGLLLYAVVLLSAGARRRRFRLQSASRPE